mmetsp:Transcript_9416/g.13767  ORF Transcript_9416/g.13767 Transcript_9416/m.13767 type:complete len:165 (+) Transcript_9416:63-557(+)
MSTTTRMMRIKLIVLGMVGCCVLVNLLPSPSTVPTIRRRLSFFQPKKVEQPTQLPVQQQQQQRQEQQHALPQQTSPKSNTVMDYWSSMSMELQATNNAMDLTTTTTTTANAVVAEKEPNKNNNNEFASDHEVAVVLELDHEDIQPQAEAMLASIREKYGAPALG